MSLSCISHAAEKLVIRSDSDTSGRSRTQGTVMFDNPRYLLVGNNPFLGVQLRWLAALTSTFGASTDTAGV